jgi:hypothetical protein
MRTAAALALLLALAVPAAGQDHVAVEGPGPGEGIVDAPAWPVGARLSVPTDRYAHGVLGGIPMFARLEVEALACGACRHGREGDGIDLPAHLVFEDVAPRLWDADGDGRPEIVVVEAHVTRGARLAVWAYPDKGVRNARLARLAATAFIGRPQRWLAPAGIGDFDGDGRPEIAYVDRPHLARELVFVRLDRGRLVEIARAPGFSNHRIGDTAIASATRRCDGHDEVLLPDPDRRRLLAVRLDGRRIVTRDAGPWRDPASLRRQPGC